MPKYSYIGWIGSEQFSTKADNAPSARRSIAWQYRNRHQAWNLKIKDIMAMITLSKDYQ